MGAVESTPDPVVDLDRWKASRRTADPPRDQTPLARLSRDEPGAVAACVDAYGPFVRALARRLLPEGTEVDDVVQDAMVDVWRSAGSFDPARASDRGFVAMIARRRIIDQRRRQDRRIATVPMSDERDRPSGEYERTLGRVAAHPAVRALQQLTGDRRRWIVMAVIEGYSHRDIARATETPLGTVKSGIRRGLAEMRAWITEHAPHEDTP
ncbi:MAG: sigma-70 family RNA polymerase sigma factor [Gemmatimonadetes bacterium]|nr:sigma-70 family RNA polymerase sigma factor [Gemmatimonadota bacterium]